MDRGLLPVFMVLKLFSDSLPFEKRNRRACRLSLVVQVNRGGLREKVGELTLER